MQKHLTLVLTRKHWVPGNVEANFREYKRHTSKIGAMQEIITLVDDDFEPLGIRDEDKWVWQQ
jgi:hypothetical protein